MKTHRTRLKYTRLMALACCAAVPCGVALLPAEAAQDRAAYARVVDPIFQEKCVACHNHTVRQGGLNLESYEALMNGGKGGPSIVPGKSGESRLVQMIEGTVSPRMPLGDQLTPAEIKAVRDWVDGAAVSEPLKVKAAADSKVPEIKPTVPVHAAVSSLAFPPDGSLLALGGYQEVEFLTPGDGQSRGKLGGHAGQVRALAFSPDGKLLAAAGGNPAQFGEVKIWSVGERKELRSIRGHRDNIFAVAFSPDGKLLATSSYDRLIKLWDVTTGAEVKTLKDHTDAVFGLAFSPDGTRLASASADRTVKIWDVSTGQRLYTLGDALDALNAVAFHPTGKLIAAGGADRTIRIWELGATEGRQLRALIAHEDAINLVTFSPDGRRLASTGADRLLKLWEPETLSETHAFERQPDWILALAFSPDGKTLAAGRYDGSVSVYDPATGKLAARRAP